MHGCVELPKSGRSLFGVCAAAQPALAQKQQCVFPSAGQPGSFPMVATSCSTHWAQQAANARGYSQPSASQIFLMKLQLHKRMIPLFVASLSMFTLLLKASLSVKV